MSERVRFLFGVHNHQPADNFESVILDAARDAYQPFLEAVRDAPGISLTVHAASSGLPGLGGPRELAVTIDPGAS